jgi:hypothetical protein
MKNPPSGFFLLVCASAVAWGCAQLRPPPPSDPLARLNNLMNSSGYFFPAPGPDGGDVYGAAFVRDPTVIKGNELPAIQGAQAYGNRMLEGARAAQECAKSPDQKLAMTCKEFLAKFCDRAKSAFELSQDETNWWRRNFATFQSDAPAVTPVKGPPKLIQQTRLIACGIDEIKMFRMFHEDDVGGNPQIAISVGPENQNPTAATPAAARESSAIAAPVPAANAVAGAVATAPPVTKAAHAKLDALTPPKKKRANPSKAPPQAATVRAAASPKLVPNAGPVASQKPRTEKFQIAAVSSDSKAVKSRTERKEREVAPTRALKRSTMSGTFAGQLFGYSGGHVFSSDLTLTLVGAGKDVKGAWTSVQGKSGKVTGTLAGSNIASLRLEQLEPCAGTYAGSAMIAEDGQRLHGTYTGTDCKGQVDASFIVVKH